MKHVVIIGGGFAGINLIERLSKKNGFIITLVDKNNYNFFLPCCTNYQQGSWKCQTSVILLENCLGERRMLISILANSRRWYHLKIK